jgi:hypothetical protein
MSPSEGKGKNLRLIRRRAYPTDEQVTLLRSGIALCNKLCVSFWQQVTMRDTFKPLHKRLVSILNRAYGAEEFATVSVNPLKLVEKRVERKAAKGIKMAPIIGCFPLYNVIPQVYPETKSLHIPMVGDVRIEPLGVEGSLKYTYFSERRDGSWIVSMVLDNYGQQRIDKLTWRARKRLPIAGDVWW